MKKIKKIEKIILDVVEVYVPILMLILLFVAFVMGVFFRYVLKNPQSWTYELSSIAFLSFVILSACYVQRTEQHIVFDMIFNKMSDRIKCIMRLISNIIISLTCLFLTPASVRYVLSMKGLTSQVLKIPRGLIFVCFIILFFSTTIRAAVRACEDVRSLKNGTYICSYTNEEVNE